MELQISKPAPERLEPPADTPYRYATINGARLPYVDEGRGPPVVCLHGAFADHRNWGPQRAVIARGHRYIAYSQRYFGPDPWPDAGELYSQETHIADLATFIRTLDAGPAYVIARSYGATVSLLAALRHPELIRALLVQEPQVKSLVTDPDEQAVLREEALGLAAVRAAANAGDTDGATRLFFDWVNGQDGGFELIPEEARRFHLANGRTIALHFAAPPAPRLSCAEVQALFAFRSPSPEANSRGRTCASAPRPCTDACPAHAWSSFRTRATRQARRTRSPSTRRSSASWPHTRS